MEWKTGLNFGTEKFWKSCMQGAFRMSVGEGILRKSLYVDFKTFLYQNKLILKFHFPWTFWSIFIQSRELCWVYKTFSHHYNQDREHSIILLFPLVANPFPHPQPLTTANPSSVSLVLLSGILTSHLQHYFHYVVFIRTVQHACQSVQKKIK